MVRLLPDVAGPAAVSMIKPVPPVQIAPAVQSYFKLEVLPPHAPADTTHRRPTLHSPPNAEFAASAAAIRRLPKAFWEGLQDYLMSTQLQSFKAAVSGRAACGRLGDGGRGSSRRPAEAVGICQAAGPQGCRQIGMLGLTGLGKRETHLFREACALHRHFNLSSSDAWRPSRLRSSTCGR